MILKTLSTTNGTATFHVLKKLESLKPFSVITLTVDSYVSEAVFMAGGSFMGRFIVNMPASAMTSEAEGAAEKWLTTDESSMFVDGTITLDNSDTLEAAQSRAWSRIKAERSRVEVGNFEFDGGMYQADVQRINGAATLALMSQLDGKPYSVDWTLTDNTIRKLDVTKAMGLGAAVGKYVDGIYGIARELRVAIKATKTVEEANAIMWPTASSTPVPMPTPTQPTTPEVGA